MSSERTNTHEDQYREWERIYREILREKRNQFPKGFWNKKGREKAQHLLRYYVNHNAIGMTELEDKNNRELIKNAKLQTALSKAYNDNSYRMIAEVFPNIDKKDLRWTINREIDWERAKELRNKYCTLNEIAAEFGMIQSVLRKRAKKEGVDLSKPDDKPAILASIEEIEYFWEQVEKTKKREVTMEEMMENLKKENGWSESRINKLMLRHGVKEHLGRWKSKYRKRTPYKEYNSYLHPTEKLVIERLNQEEIEMLTGFGADLIYKNQTIIEIKKSIHGYSMEHGLLQLLYAKDLLEDSYELAFYTNNYDLSKKKFSRFKRMLNYYRIKIYEYNENKDDFVQINY